MRVKTKQSMSTESKEWGGGGGCSIKRMMETENREVKKKRQQFTTNPILCSSANRKKCRLGNENLYFWS